MAAKQKLYDIHIGGGNCFTLRQGWFLRIEGEQRYYHIKGIKDNQLSLDMYELREGKGVLADAASGYQYNCHTFNYRALKGQLLCQKAPFGEHIAPPKPKRKPKAKEKPTPEAVTLVFEGVKSSPPAPKPQKTEEKDTIMDLFGI